MGSTWARSSTDKIVGVNTRRINLTGTSIRYSNTGSIHMRFRNKKLMQEWYREMVNPDHTVDMGLPGDRVTLRAWGRGVIWTYRIRRASCCTMTGLGSWTKYGRCSGSGAVTPDAVILLARVPLQALTWGRSL